MNKRIACHPLEYSTSSFGSSGSRGAEARFLLTRVRVDRLSCALLPRAGETFTLMCVQICIIKT